MSSCLHGTHRRWLFFVLGFGSIWAGLAVAAPDVVIVSNRGPLSFSFGPDALISWFGFAKAYATTVPFEYV